MMRTLAVVPARGGSKGVPGKNIRPLGGIPLIAHTLRAARAARTVASTAVSTDDAAIADAAAAEGFPPAFMRPPELAADDTPTLPVVQHAVRAMEEKEGQAFDAVVLLQPTAPLRLASDIDDALRMLEETGADSVVSVEDVAGYHPLRMKRIVGDRLVNYIDQGHEDMRPRQALPPAYIRNGAIYASRRAVIMDGGTLVGPDCRALVMPAERSVNIDSEDDLVLAALALSRRDDG